MTDAEKLNKIKEIVERKRFEDDDVINAFYEIQEVLESGETSEEALKKIIEENNKRLGL